MANGYGGSGGSSGSGGSGGSGGSLGYSSAGQSMDSMREGYGGGFVKIKDGVKAPDGFHYMPNGKLMSDAHHIAESGYVQKNINDIIINYGDIAPSGGTKIIDVRGEEGFVFSVEVYEGNRASYYNFKSQTWSSAIYKQNKVQGESGVNSLSVIFPAQASLKTFTINIYAETVENIKTKHATYTEVKNEDGSINLNKSTGSDSEVVTKILYQDVIKTLSISAIAPSLYRASADTVSGAVSSSNRIIIDGDATDPDVVQIGDLVTGTGIAASVGALVTKINPDNDNIHEIEISVADSIGDGVAITFTPKFNGVKPHFGVSTTGVVALNVVSGASEKYKFELAIKAADGRALSIQKQPTVEDLCFVTEIDFKSAPLPIQNEDVSASTFRRWPIVNLANLNEGDILDPSRTGGGGNTTTPAVIRSYRTTKTLSRISNENKYYTDFNEYQIEDVSISGVDGSGSAATAVDRNGRVTAREGNITFDVSQPDALKNDANVKIIAQGARAIKQATGMSVQLNINSIEITSTDGIISPVSTTTSAATSSSTTIPVDEARNIVVGSTIRGLGIDPNVADPTVISKAAATGAVNIVASSAQTLEDNTTLFFDGFAQTVVITGIIDIANMPISDTILYFNVERFLGCR